MFLCVLPFFLDEKMLKKDDFDQQTVWKAPICSGQNIQRKRKTDTKREREKNDVARQRQVKIKRGLRTSRDVKRSCSNIH